MLDPGDRLRELERDGNYTERLALMESMKTMPFGSVWDHYCAQQEVPVGVGYMDEIKAYEQTELAKR